MNFLSLSDIFVPLVYAILILLFAYFIQQNRVRFNPAYRYFVAGLAAKVVGAILFALVYTFYYDGGDTTNYFLGSKAIINLFYNYPADALSILFGNLSPENFSLFDGTTGYPPHYMWKDAHTFSVCRYSVPFVFLSFNSFIGATVLLSAVSFIGIWKLFLLLIKLYPQLQKQFAISLLFVPSVVFWGSGLLKDTYSFGAVCLFVATFYGFFFEKKKLFINGLGLFFAIFFLATIKPYILYSLLPGVMIWLSFKQIKAIQSTFVKVIIGPAFIAIAMGLAFFTLTRMDDSFGKYSMDNAVNQAQVMQEDLKREVYGTNSFDIGTLDGTLINMVSKAPVAINAALFRPYIFEARSAMLFISGLENLVLLAFSLWVLFKVGLFRSISLIKNDPFLIFALSFTLIFAFMVGVSTANFGALVRYKIPFVPFYLSVLIVILNKVRNQHGYI
ncbi:MAG: hypothetical protein H0X62_11805 [Bacteroidetes bacterium]|nr:hypothetical protein [Bacteroidota bacterium]